MTYPLNLIDLCFTLYAVHHGATEINPLMRCVPVMVIHKTVIIGVLCWWLRRRTEPIARYGLIALAVVFAAVNVWHIWNLIGVILW